MIITRKHVSRRAVLRGISVSLSLPLLDCMVPALTALGKTAAAPVRRLGVFYVPNGMSMPYWYPPRFSEGALTALPPTLRSLDELKDRVLMVGGLASEAAKLLPGGDHSKSSATFLTGVAFKRETVFAGVSMDQIAAAELGKETQLASLELCIEDPGLTGSCEGGPTCAYLNTIAWRTPTTPLAMENDPRAVFERMFGASGSTDRTIRLARIKRDHSILDYVGSDASRLQNVLGPQDQIKIAEYLDSVRDIERRIQIAERQNGVELPVIDQPIGIPTNYDEHAKLMMDLLLIAYQTDLTRISTFMMGKEVSNRAYPEIGIADSHHPLSHHQDDPGKLEQLSKVNQYHFDQFAHLVKRLAATPEGDGTMLDYSLFLYGTAISDSNTHFHDDLPIALVAGKGTGITSGRYVRYGKQPLTNLHLAILEKLAVPTERLGDSTGRLESLTGL
jgi:hypothetical protein